MRRIAIAAAAVLAAAALPTALAARTPGGRSQMLLFSDRQVRGQAEREFERVKATEPLVTDGPAYEALQRVGRRIAAAAGRPDYAWEFILVDSPLVNAWALPGGKVAVYTGMIPVVEDEAGLAVVLGHEIAHVLLRHGNERMSQGFTQGLVGLALSRALRSSSNRDRWLAAYGATSAVGFILPYSRRHEEEADAHGLMLMADAGYDPRAAPALWERMNARGGARPPTFLSTHPHPAARAERLRALLPRAIREYEENAAPAPSRPIPYPERWVVEREGERRGGDRLRDRYRDGRDSYDAADEGEGGGFRIEFRF